MSPGTSDKYICMLHHIKKFPSKHITNDTNKLFKTILVTMTYNLYRLLLLIYLYILTKMFDMSILII
jgi:hypothetical protein